MSKKDNSRDKILATAAELFYLQGYHATGINQIIKESGAPKGSVYYYFPNGKEQLVIEAIKMMSEHIRLTMKNVMDQKSDPVEAIQDVISMMAKAFDNKEIEGLPIGLLVAEVSLINETAQQASQDAIAVWENVYTEKLIQSGFSEQEAAEYALVLVALVEGAMLRSLTNQNGAALRAVAAHIPTLLTR